MLWQILIIVLVIWRLVERYRTRAMVKLHSLVKTKHLSLPFVGHAYRFIGDDEHIMKTLQDLGKESIDNGGIVSLWQGDKLYVLLSDPIAVESVLKAFLEKDDVIKCSRLLMDNGSIFAPVPIWRPRRKVLAPTFTPKNLNQFAGVFSRQSGIMTKRLREAAGKGIFSIWQYMTTYTMDSVCETALGVQVNSQMNPEQPFLHAFEQICLMHAKRLFRPWLHNDTLYKSLPSYELHSKYKGVLVDFINKVIASKRKSMADAITTDTTKSPQAEEDGLKTFLELLIQSSGAERGYSDVELQEETLVIVLAGTDTSAVGASFTTALLSRYQDVQEKVYQELQEVFGDSTRPIAADDLPRLKYLDAVLRETLRMYPPVPLIVRKADKDLELPSGVTIVKGCGVFINIWAIHHNHNYWEDPYTFRPERFIDTPLKHPAAYMPFSYGSRNCLGYQYAMLSMKTAIASLLRQYKLMPVTEEVSKHKPLRLKYDIMMKDVDNFLVQLEPRN